MIKRSTLPTFWLPLMLALGMAAFIGLAASVVGGPVTAFLFVPLLALVFVFRDYRFGVVCLAFLLPWSSSPLIPQARGLNVVNYLLIATVLSFGFRFLKVKFDFIVGPSSFFKYFILPLTVGWVVAMPHIGIAAGYFTGTEGAIGFQPLEFTKNWYIIPMGYVAFALLLANAVKESKKPERFVILFLVAGVVPAIVVLILIQIYGASLTDLQGQRNFMRPIGMHANEMAALLAFVVGPVIFVISTWKSIFSKMLNFLLVIVILAAQLLTFSRGGLVATLVILTIYIFQRRHILLLLGGLIFMVLALLFAPPAFQDRWLTGVTEDAVQQSMGNLNDPLTAGRVAVWERLLPEVKKSPVWGRGVASTAWSDLVRSGVYKATHPHNMYLALLLDLGIVGLVLVAYWYRLLIRKQLQLQQDPELSPVMRQFFAGSLAALAGVLVMNVTNGNYLPRPEYTFHWFSIGLVFAFWSVTRDQTLVKASSPRRVPRPWQLGR